MSYYLINNFKVGFVILIEMAAQFSLFLCYYIYCNMISIPYHVYVQIYIALGEHADRNNNNAHNPSTDGAASHTTNIQGIMMRDYHFRPRYSISVCDHYIVLFG